MSDESKIELSTQAKKLAKEVPQGVLATLDEQGYPYTSLVELYFDGHRHFWMVLSDLAVHTDNIRRDGRASLLLRQMSEQDEEVLATARASFVGRIIEVDPDEEVVDCYLDRHPQAEQYLGFSDFSFYRFYIERLRLVAGFGRIGWIDVDEW